VPGATAQPDGGVPDLPLDEVPFAVVDVETTGGSPTCAVLTEVAVATFVGWECIDVYDQLIDPGIPIPAFITELTGISDATVAGAPPIGDVVPTIRHQLAGRVIVGHNLPFDISFLNAAFVGSGYPVVDQIQVDTLVLARRLVDRPVANFRLGTLADALSLAHRPAHRALADVLATADLLQHLLLRLATTGLDRLPQLVFELDRRQRSSPTRSSSPTANSPSHRSTTPANATSDTPAR